MLVYNPCINDSRVIREAEALVQVGYAVTVLAKRDPTAPIRETRSGVDYRRVLSVTDTWHAPVRRLARLVTYVRRDPFRPTLFQRMAAGIAAVGRRRNSLTREDPDSGERAGFLDRVIGWALAIFSLAALAAILPLRLANSGLRWTLSRARQLPAASIRLARRLGVLLAVAVRRWVYRPTQVLIRQLRRYTKELMAPISSLAKKLLPRRLKMALRGTARRTNLLGGEAVAVLGQALRPLSGFARRIGHGAAQLVRRTRNSPANFLRRINAWTTMKIKRPLTLRVKRLVASAFIFEVVDIAMRRQLLRLRPDIIHAHDLMTLPTAARVASDIGARLVYDSHELEMHRNAHYSRYAWRRRGRKEKRYIRKADLVITVSDSIADHLRDTYRIPRPIVVMNTPPLGIKGSTAEMTIRRKLGLKKSTPLAIYVGSVTVNRGIEMCVKALAHYPELHFATIGPRRKPNEIELLEIAQDLGVSERFHMIDPVPADTVVSFVRTADVSVLPIQNVCLSYYYCMPNKLFESVVGGLPVAVADLVELRRFVERYECGVIMDETDPRDIARAIRQIMENRPTYLLDDVARTEVQATYTWPAQAAKLVEAYERIPLSLVQRERTRVAAN